MMLMFLLLAALTGHVYSTGTYKCDDNIVDKITAFWNGTVPSGMIKTAMENGKEVVVGTTEGCYSDDVKSVFSYFVQEKCSCSTRVDVYKLLNNGTLESSSMYVKEVGGITCDSNNKIRRYHVYQDEKGGVTGCYVCSESTSAECGPPAGMIKVRAHDYNKTSLTKAYKVFKSLGLPITTTYSLT